MDRQKCSFHRRGQGLSYQGHDGGWGPAAQIPTWKPYGPQTPHSCLLLSCLPCVPTLPVPGHPVSLPIYLVPQFYHHLSKTPGPLACLRDFFARGCCCLSF
jgi:hypothetical protein